MKFRSRYSGRGSRPVLTPRQQLETKYKSARLSLILFFAISVLNIVLALTGSDSYYLWTAIIPYYLVVFGMLYCGKLPPEYYEDLEGFEFWDPSVLTVFVVIAFIMIAFYGIFWLCSRKNRIGWLVAALVFVVVDTLGIFVFGFDFSMILDVIFHVWMIYSLAVGIFAGRKLKTMPPDEPEATDEPQNSDGDGAQQNNSDDLSYFFSNDTQNTQK